MLQFDEVHVISDLHLGGEKGFQIFGSTAELVAFIDALATAEVKKEIALVINGDYMSLWTSAILKRENLRFCCSKSRKSRESSAG